MNGAESRRRWLIISLQGLGDTIMLTPLLRRLDAMPDVSLTMVLSDNGSAQYIRTLHLRRLSEIYIWRERDSAVKNILRLAPLLARDAFDTAVATYPSGRRESLLLFVVRADEKRIFRYYKGFLKSWQFLHPRAPVADPGLHNVEANARLLGVPLPENRARACRLSDNEIPTVGFHIGSKGESKRWSVDNFAQVMWTLRERFGCRLVVFAGRDEVGLVEMLRARLSEGFEALVGRDFTEVITSLSGLALFVGNDSSVAHLASTVGVPTIVLWSFGEFWRVSPYGKGNIVLKRDYSCIPCYDFTKPYVVDCPFRLRCIKDIPASHVSEVATVYLNCILEGRVLSSQELSKLDFVVAVEQLRTGCWLVTLGNTG